MRLPSWPLLFLIAACPAATPSDGGPRPPLDAGPDAGATTDDPPSPPLGEFSTSTQQALQAIVDAAESEHDGYGGVVLRIESRSEQLLFAGVAGQTFRQSGVAMHVESTLEAASVSKAFTGAAVLLLVDDGLVELDTPAAAVLPPAVMENLLVVDGVGREGEITVGQLLAHRSGLPHYWDDPPFVTGLDNAFILEFFSDLDRFWTPEDILAHVKALDPAGPPGAQYHYADGGYLLLGMIVESVSGMTLHDFYRTRLFEPLGLDSAHLSYREDARPGFEASHLYWGQEDMSGVQAMSADWAGGGLIMNARDLARFMFAVVGGDVLSPSSLEALRSWSTTGVDGIDYGLGMFRVDYSQFEGYEPLVEVYGHDGYGGAFMYYWPQEDLVLSGSLNHAEGDCFELLIEPALQVLIAAP